MSRVLRLSERTVDLGTGEVAGHGRLRPTELAMLAYLAERAGELVGVDELHARVWGYAPGVVTRAAYTTASRLRAAIEPDPAAPRHLLAERGGGYRLVEVGWERVAPVSRPLGNLPEPDTLFGRTEELARLRAPGTRLWSVVGPGGIGKTRLVVEAARGSCPPAGAWFCDLQLATSPAAIEAEVARVLPGRGPIPERLRQTGEILLVLDSLASAELAAGPCEQWLAQVPSLRILASARKPLVPVEPFRVCRSRLTASTAGGTSASAASTAPNSSSISWWKETNASGFDAASPIRCARSCWSRASRSVRSCSDTSRTFTYTRSSFPSASRPAL